MTHVLPSLSFGERTRQVRGFVKQEHKLLTVLRVEGDFLQHMYQCYLCRKTHTVFGKVDEERLAYGRVNERYHPELD